MDAKNFLSKDERDISLLGICPVFPEVVEAAFEEAVEEEYPPMFVATPRQVDADRGYTGWSQQDLMDFCRETAERKGYEGPYLVARDHGGPYQSMRDRGDSSVKLDTAIGYSKELFRNDLEAGFDIIHVDATEDPRVDGILDLDKVADRTAELIVSTEEYRRNQGLSEVYYEVGTEEVVGGMTDPDSFERFVDLLRGKLESGQGPTMEKLMFVVGQVGTTMRIDMKNNFDPAQAKKLVKIVSEKDLFLKVHYTDWLSDPVLEEFPEIGIGAANVGPEFATALIKGLERLEEKEVDVLEKSPGSEECSNFMEVLEEEAFADAPWRKFVPPEVPEEDIDSYGENNKRNIALCVGRYVMNKDGVKEAREKLYRNLERFSNVDDPDRLLVDKIKERIDRYVSGFNLSQSLK